MDRRRWRGRYTCPRGVWSEDIKNRFLAVLRETGNASEAGRRVGHMQMFRKRRKRHSEFAREWEEAVKAADDRLKGAEYDFVGTREDGEPRALTPGPSPAEGRGELPTDPDTLGGYLRPGRKRKSSRPEPVIRRTSNGRTQITFAREGHMTSEIEADFLARLRATGNFRRSALAVGFQPASVGERARKWPAFKRACDEALEEASVMLDYDLVAYARALLRRPGEAAEAGEEVDDTPFDPEMAMRILAFLDRRKAGRTGGRQRKGPPERTFEEAVESILAKIDAIEKHEALMKARGEAGRGG